MNDSRIGKSDESPTGDVSKATREDLLEALRQGKSTVRIKAARSLGRRKEKAAVAALIVALDDGDEWVATEAAEALGNIGSPDAVPGLLETLHGSDWCGQCDSMDEDCLKSEGNTAHAAVAAAQLSLDVESLRAAAATALGRIGDPRAVPGLAAILQDGHRTAPKEAAIRALRAIATPEARKALEEAGLKIEEESPDRRKSPA